MSAEKPRAKDFGKRRPEPPPPATPPVKRSGHVALLVMGTIAVGTTAYTLMPSTCEPTSPGVASAAQPGTTCASRSSSGSGGHWSSRSSFFSSGSTSHSSSAGSAEAAGGVTRGGFGSFGHAFFSGGG